MPPLRPLHRFPSIAWGLAWLIGTLVSLAVFARPATTPLDEDELYWIGSTYYHHLALVRGDWTHPDWALLPARENPPVAKYLLGLALSGTKHPVTSIDMLGVFYLRFESIPGAWGHGADHAKREAVVHRMNPGLRDNLRGGAQLQFDPATLARARYVMIGCVILTSALLLVLGWLAVSPLAGLLASQLLLLHPAVIHAYNHAHADIVALLFSTAAAIAAFLFARRAGGETGSTLRSQLAAATGLGGLLALACGAKMNALVVVGLASIALLFAVGAAWRRNRRQGLQTALCGVAVFVTACAIFVLINPTIVSDIRAGLWATVEEHRLTEQIQAQFLRGHLTSLAQKAAAVAQLVTFSPLVLATLTVLAGGALASKRPGLRFATAWYLVGLGCVTLWIPFVRGRYALPVIVPAVLLVAVLAAVLIEWLIARWRPRPTTGNSIRT